MPDSPQDDRPDGTRSDSADPRPLADQIVLITRAAGQADSLSELLEKLGANTVFHPVIRIAPPEDFSAVDRVISRIAEFDRIVFVSANGVQYFLQRVIERTGSVETLANHPIAAIGVATSDRLASFGEFNVDLVATKSDSRSLGRNLAATNQGNKLLILRANRGSQELAKTLVDAGIEFEELVVYQSVDVEAADPEVTQRIQSGEIDWITVTSSAIARSTVRLFGDAVQATKLVSISPLTTAALIELGFPPAAEAEDYNMAGLVEAIVKSSRM